MPATLSKGFSVTELTSSTAFSAPVATSVHGASYANVIVPVPTEEICSYMHTLTRGMEKFANFQGFGTKTDSYSEAYNDDRLTRKDGDNFRFTTLWFRLQTVRRKCINVQQIVQPLPKLADKWFHNSPAGKRALRELEAFKRAHARRNKRIAIMAMVKLVGAVLFVVSTAITLSNQFSNHQLESNHKRAVMENSILLSEGSILTGQSLNRVAAILDGVQWQIQADGDSNRVFARIELSLDLIDDAITSASRYLQATTMGKFPMEALLHMDLPRLAGMLERRMHEEDAQAIALRPTDLASSLGSFVQQPHGFDLVLSVPMGKPSNTLTVRRVTNVGTTMPDGTRVKIHLPTLEYIGTSLDGNYWVAFSTADLESCRRISGVSVCDSLTVLHKTPSAHAMDEYTGKSEEWCLYGLYASNPQLVKTACEVSAVSMIETVVRTSETEIVINSNNNVQQARVDCPDPAKGGHVHLSEVSAIRIDANCSVDTPQHLFSPASSSFLTTMQPISNMWPEELKTAIFDNLLEEQGNHSQHRFISEIQGNAHRLQAIGWEVGNNTLTMHKYAVDNGQALVNSAVLVLGLLAALIFFLRRRILQKYHTWRNSLQAPPPPAPAPAGRPLRRMAPQPPAANHPQPLTHAGQLAIGYLGAAEPTVTFPTDTV